LADPSEKGRVIVVPSLLADVGATNARFALIGAEREFQRVRVLACEDYPSIQDAIGAYLNDELALTDLQRVEAAALAVAGPVTDDQITLTNHPWSFSISQLRRYLATDRLLVVNDLAAVAVATPYLRFDERNQVGGGKALASAPIGVLGPGSGLGVSGLVTMPAGCLPLSGEGGHVAVASATARERRPRSHAHALRSRFGGANPIRTRPHQPGTTRSPRSTGPGCFLHIGTNHCPEHWRA
jgi:glucokinase